MPRRNWASTGGVRPPRARAGIVRPQRPRNINVTVPGYTPDWNSLIQNDPRMAQQLGINAGRSAADKARRNAQIKAKLIAFGSLPDLAGVDLGDFGLDADTIAAIQANTNPNTSTTAGLQRQNAQNVQALQDMLAARGMLRSGSLGVGLSQEQERFTGAQTAARDELLNLLRGYQTDFAQAEQDRYDTLYGPGGLADDVKDDLQDSGLYEPTAASSKRAVRDPSTGLYVDADGNYYNQDGTPALPRSPRAPANRPRPRFRRTRRVPGYRP